MKSEYINNYLEPIEFETGNGFEHVIDGTLEIKRKFINSISLKYRLATLAG